MILKNSPYSYELQWDGEWDTEEYKKQCEEQRRESLPFRNADGVRQRLEKEDKDANDLCDKHDSYELKWAGEYNTKEYKKQCEEQRRESLPFRNAEGVRQRLVKENNDVNDLCEQHDSYELKWADEYNTKKYKKKCEEQSRESFAFGNAEGVRQRLEKEIKDANDLCEQHDSYELKWDGEYNTEAYKKQCKTMQWTIKSLGTLEWDIHT